MSESASEGAGLIGGKDGFNKPLGTNDNDIPNSASKETREMPLSPPRHTALMSMRSPPRLKSETPFDEPTPPCSPTTRGEPLPGSSMLSPNPSLSHATATSIVHPDHDNLSIDSLGRSNSLGLTEDKPADVIETPKDTSTPQDNPKGSSKSERSSLRKKLFRRTSKDTTTTSTTPTDDKKQRWGHRRRKASAPKSSVQPKVSDEYADTYGYSSDDQYDSSSSFSGSFGNWTASTSGTQSTSKQSWPLSWLAGSSSVSSSVKNSARGHNDHTAELWVQQNKKNSPYADKTKDPKSRQDQTCNDAANLKTIETFQAVVESPTKRSTQAVSTTAASQFTPSLTASTQAAHPRDDTPSSTPAGKGKPKDQINKKKILPLKSKNAMLNNPDLRFLMRDDLVHLHSIVSEGDSLVHEGFYDAATKSYRDALHWLFSWIKQRDDSSPTETNAESVHSSDLVEPDFISFDESAEEASDSSRTISVRESFFSYLDQWFLRKGNESASTPDDILHNGDAYSSSQLQSAAPDTTNPISKQQLRHKDMTLLLRVISSLFIKLGNARFNLRQFEIAIIDYNDARRSLDQERRTQSAELTKSSETENNTTQDQNSIDPLQQHHSPDLAKEQKESSKLTPSQTFSSSGSVGSSTASSIPTDTENFSLEDSLLVGKALTNIASAYAVLNNYEQSTSRYAEALKIKRLALRFMLEENKSQSHQSDTKTSRSGKETPTSFHNDINVVLDIARTLHNIGLLRFKQKYYIKAQDAYKQSLALRVEKCGLDNLSVASTLNNLGDVYFAQGDFDVALRSYMEVLRVRRLCLGSRHALVGTTWHNIGLVHYKNGPYGKSRSALMDALRIRRETLGDAHPDLAATLHLLGVVLTTLGELDDAMRCLLGALRIRRRLLGRPQKEETSDLIQIDSDRSQETAEEHLLILNTKFAIGTVHRKRGDLEEAFSSFQSVLCSRMRQLGNEHQSVAEALQAIAAALRDASEHEKAVEALREALRIYRERLGKESLEAAETMALLGLSYLKLGQFDESDKLCTDALRIVEDKAGKEHILYAQVLRVFGDLRQEQADYSRALKAYDHVIRVSARWHDTKHLDVGDTFNAVGNACFKRGDFKKAEESFTEALRIKRLWLDDDNVSIFTTLNNLGHTQYKNKDLDLALKSYTESLYLQQKRLSGRLDEHIGGPDLISTTREVIDEIKLVKPKDDEIKDFSSAVGNLAATLRNIALVHQDKGDLDQALAVYELTLAARKVQPLRNNPAIAATAETIGMLQFKKGSHDAAMAAFYEALEVKKEYQGNSTIDVARTLNNLANMHFSKGNLDDAMSMYIEALEIKKLRLGNDSEDVANTLNNIAHVMFTSGREDESLKAYSEVLRIRHARQGGDCLAVGVTLGNMGDVHAKQGNLALARTCLEQSLQIRKMQSHNYAENARTSETLALVYGKLGEWRKAEVAYSDALLLKQATYGMDHLELVKTLELLAVSKIKQGKGDEVIPHLEEALRIRKLHSSSNQSDIADTLNQTAVPELRHLYAEIIDIQEPKDQIEINSSEEASSDSGAKQPGTCFEI